MYDVITIGDAVQDIFIKPCSSHFCNLQINVRDDKLWIRHGDKISVDEIHFAVGGSAANVAVGLSRLGLKTAIIGAVGDDLVAHEICQQLSDELIDIQWLKSYRGMMTSTSAIVVFKGERTIFVYRGLRDYSQLTIPKTLRTRWIYLGPMAKEISSKYNHLISLASEKDIHLAINPGNRQMIQGRNDLLRLLKVVEILILNKREALDFTQLPVFTDPKKLLMVIKNYGPQIVLITDGKNGAYVTDGTNFWGIPIFPVQVKDPTGAGDAFSSGFLASFIKEKDMQKALQRGIINSAMVIEEYGAQTNLQTADQINKLLEKSAPRLYKL